MSLNTQQFIAQNTGEPTCRKKFSGIPGVELEGDTAPAEPRMEYGVRSAALRNLAVGESLFAAGAYGQRSLWQSAAASFARRHGWKFTTRSVVKDGKEGVRIRRVA
jgi:hypothetical protein